VWRFSGREPPTSAISQESWSFSVPHLSHLPHEDHETTAAGSVITRVSWAHGRSRSRLDRPGPARSLVAVRLTSA
jgi:hypothetical protein